MKRIIFLLLAVLILLTATACAGKPAYSAESTIFSGEGYKITLTDAFEQKIANGFDACFDSSDVAVFLKEESFEEAQELESYTLEQYANAVREANLAKSPSDVQREQELTFFEFEYYSEGQKITYSYFLCVFKSEDSFWTAQFACEKSIYVMYKPYFITWASTFEV